MFKKIIVTITVISSFAFTSSVQAQSCRTQTMLGGLIGGGLGTLFKNHKDAAVISGALLGGSIANDECEEEDTEQQQQVGLYPQPVYGGYYPNNLYRAPYCQITSQVFHDGYGGYYTQWQEICN